MAKRSRGLTGCEIDGRVCEEAFIGRIKSVGLESCRALPSERDGDGRIASMHDACKRAAACGAKHYRP